MTSLGPKLLRYALSAVFLSLGILGQLGALITGYAVFDAVYPPAPDLTMRGLVLFASSPRFSMLVVALGVVTTGAGVRRYGSLASFLVASTAFADDVLRLSLFDEPLVEGRIRHGDVGWRLRYWDDDRIEVCYQECPRCGVELDEQYVPRHELHAPNVSFASDRTIAETEQRAWADVHGEETSLDRDESLGLVCPQCRIAVPGTKDAVEGRQAARAKFRKHVEQMKLGNPRDDPFASYAAGPDGGDGDPTPGTVWDRYVVRRDDEDLLPVGVDSGSPPDERGGARTEGDR